MFVVARAARLSFGRHFSSSIRFTETHEWIKFDAATLTGSMGISNHAQSELGDCVFCALPKKGASVSQGSPLGAVESVKAASDVYAPVDLVVTDVNAVLADTPTLINESAEEKGWIAKFQVKDASQFNKLLTKEQYDKHVQASKH